MNEIHLKIKYSRTMLTTNLVINWNVGFISRLAESKLEYIFRTDRTPIHGQKVRMPFSPTTSYLFFFFGNLRFYTNKNNNTNTAEACPLKDTTHNIETIKSKKSKQGQVNRITSKKPN